MSRPIIPTLGQLNEGRFLADASDELSDLVRAINETGKSGKISLEITIRKATRGGAMVLVGKIKTNKPATAPSETMMFADEDGGLLTDDPRQTRLDLRVLPDPTNASLKSV